MQLIQTLQEIHPDKLIGVIRKYVKDGRGDEVRQAIPTLVDKHPSLKDQLGEIMLDLKQLIKNVDLITTDNSTVFACANCGGTLSRQSPKTVQVVCQYCGCDSEHPPADGMSQWDRHLDTTSDFTLGSYFNLRGVKWQAIGVQRYTGNLKEYDSEDETWETTRMSYTLWWMINEKRELGWLTDYGSNRYWSEKFIPKKPQLPPKGDRNLEYGDWNLQFAAGEFSYQPVRGEKRQSAEFKKHQPGMGAKSSTTGDRYVYAIESAIGENGKPADYEFIRSIELSHKEVMAAVGNSGAMQVVRRWASTAGFFFATLACIAVAFFALPSMLGSDQLLSQQVSLLDNVAADAGELRIEETDALVRLKTTLQSGLPANKYLELELEIVDSEGNAVGGFANEFWHETGRDSDGSWRESRFVFNNDIRFREAGNYKLLATISDANVARKATVNITANTNPVEIPPFLGAGVAAIIAGVLSLIRSKAKATSGASIGASMAPRKRGRKPARRRTKNSAKA